MVYRDGIRAMIQEPLDKPLDKIRDKGDWLHKRRDLRHKISQPKCGNSLANGLFVEYKYRGFTDMEKPSRHQQFNSATI
jgi:hypothetical protein